MLCEEFGFSNSNPIIWDVNTQSAPYGSILMTKLYIERKPDLGMSVVFPVEFYSPSDTFHMILYLSCQAAMS